MVKSDSFQDYVYSTPTRDKILLVIYGWTLALFDEIVPIVPVMLTVGLVIAVDTFLGIWAARKRGEPFSSNGLSRFTGKMFVYQMTIFTLFFFEKYITGSALPLVKGAALSLCSVEVYSILENAKFITGKDESAIKTAIKFFSSKSNKFPVVGKSTKQQQSKED